ncbi:hypothetical protein Tco_1120771 [Tanacetum coccineum]
MRKILENTESNKRELKTGTKNLQEKAYQLTHKVLTNTEEKVKAITTMGKENMKEPVPRDLPPTLFVGHLKEQIGSPYSTRETVRMIGYPEEIHNAKAQEEEGDMNVGWDISSKVVERLKQFLTPTIHTLPNLEPVVQPYIPLGPVHDKDKIVREKEQDYDFPLNDSVMQPLTPQTVHITPPDNDYVAPATNPMSNKQLNKFEEEFSHITENAHYPLLLPDYYSEDQYAVSIKEDTAYPCLHLPKTTKERRSIRRIQKKSIRLIEDIVCEYSGRYQTWSLLQETPIRRIQSLGYASIEEVMVDKGKKSSMETFAPNNKADYYFGITSITVNEKNAYDLKGKFLDDLHNNAFSGTNRRDALEVHRDGFDGIKKSITCWVDLTAKLFGKYYPPSRIEGNNTPVIKWDPANPKFEGWLATKFVNYKTMDIFTKGASWDYWKMGSDEIEVSDDESSDLEKYRSDKEEETAEIFKIETDIFDYETPLCLAFNKFNYILKVDPDLLTKDTMGFKTYEDYKDDWIYEWNKNVPWVYDKPWLDNGIWKEPKPVKYTCKPFNYKTRCSEWPTCSWREDGYCNGGNLPGAYRIGNSLRYQDLKWYEALEENELKDEALRNKAIMEGLISNDESGNDCWKRWKSYEIYYHDYHEGEYENETHEQGHELSKLARC